MKSYKEWKKDEEEKPNLRTDRLGGLVPENIERAKKVDLLTLPVTGTNCGNCEYYNNGWCEHKKVLMHVNTKMCCSEWSHEDAIRHFDKGQLS